MKHLERALDQQNQWWIYPAMFIITSIASGFAAIPLFEVMRYKAFQRGDKAPSLGDITDYAAYGVSPNLGLLLMLLTSAGALITFMLLVKPLHERSFTEVINGTNRIRWSRFFFAALVWGLLLGAYLLTDYSINPRNFQFNFSISSFIPLVLISVLLFPVQTTFEEVLFRGYFAQGVAAWTRSRWLVIMIPAVLFGLLHSGNPEVKEFGFWKAIPQYVVFGLLFGLITVLDDGIEAAMGAHAANNIFASTVLTFKASVIQTPALFNQLQVNPVKETWLLIILSVIFIAILAHKYKWKFSTLNRRVAYATTSDLHPPV